MSNSSQYWIIQWTRAAGEDASVSRINAFYRSRRNSLNACGFAILLFLLPMLGSCGGGDGAAAPGQTASTVVDTRRDIYPLDLTFAEGGGLIVPSPYIGSGRPSLDIRAVVPAAGGGVWAVGVIGPIIAAGAVVKLDAQGRADTACGASGVRVFDTVAGREKPFFNRIVKSRSGALYVGGAAGFVPFVAKLDPFSCDWIPSYGSSGVALLPAVQAFGDTGAFIHVDASDRVFVVANAGGKTFMARFDAAGQLDRSFGVDGVAVFSTPGGFRTSAVASSSDGRIYLGGSASKAFGFDAAIARLLPSGAADASFGGAGMARFEVVSKGTASISGLVVLAEGGVIAAGNTAIDATTESIFSNDSFALRIRSDATLDPSFGNAGWLRWDWGFSSSDILTALILRNDGRVAACGHSILGIVEGQRASVVHLTASGAFDTPAAGGGRALLYSLPGADCFAIAEDAANRLIIGGTVPGTSGLVARTMR